MTKFTKYELCFIFIIWTSYEFNRDKNFQKLSKSYVENKNRFCQLFTFLHYYDKIQFCLSL